MTKLLDYNFEDWGGNIASTPGYIYTQSDPVYAATHAAATEVVTTYNANDMSQIWTPRTGTYMLLQNASGDYDLDPSVAGITVGSVNARNNIGGDHAYGGGSDLNLGTAVTTGIVFMRCWVRFNTGYGTVPAPGGRRLKFCRLYSLPDLTENTVYMHLASNQGVSSKRYFYRDGWVPGESGPTLTNAYDGNWHKFSMYVNWNNGTIYGWYDVDNETLLNATKSYTDPGGSHGTGTGPEQMVLHSNFSASSPGEETYSAIDQVQIWDELPVTTSPVITAIKCEGVASPGSVTDTTPEFCSDVTIAVDAANVSEIEVQVSATDNFAGDLVYDSGALTLDSELAATGTTDEVSYGD